MLHSNNYYINCGICIVDGTDHKYDTCITNANYAAKLANTTEPARVNITNAISMAACATAAELKTAAITTVTKSGFTARMISRYRPACPLIASTSDETVWRKMNLIWDCKPMLYT